MNKKILITGSLAYDHIMDFPESFEENILPEKLKTLSVSFLLQNFNKNFGGVGGNIAYNLALLDQEPYLLACAGKKDFNAYKKHLQNLGINISHIKELEDEFTANAFIIVDKNNCQITGFYPGAITHDNKLSISDSEKFDFIVVSPTIPLAMNKFVLESKKLKIPFLYDPAQQIPRIEKRELLNGLESAEIIIGNDYEIALICKKTSLSISQILKKTKILITTLGAEGSMIETKNKKINIKTVKPKSVVDPTGAGDAYIAGFLTGYLKCFDLKTCGQIGATSATYAIENYGTQKHKFTLEEFKERYEKTFLEKINP